MKKRAAITLALLLLLALAAAFALWCVVCYRADDTARAALVSDAAVSVARTDYGWFFDGPGEDAG